MAIKTDSEPALIALREAVVAKLPQGSIPIQPTPGESASDGRIENGINRYEGLARVHRAALEREAAPPCKLARLPRKPSALSMTGKVPCETNVFDKSLYSLDLEGMFCSTFL